MRVGELEDSVGKEFTSRRNEVVAEAMRLPARLAEPVPGATRPAVPLLDSVHISPEARAVQFGRLGAPVPSAALPSPAEIVSVLRDIEVAPGSARAAAGIQRLVALVVQASVGFPDVSSGAPVDPRAAALVQALLSNATTGASNAATPQAIAGLVRELLSSPNQPGFGGTQAMPAFSRFEQAAVAILMAAVREAATLAIASRAPQPGELPPALLGMLGAPQPVVRRPKKRKDENSSVLDFEEDDAEESDSEPGLPGYFTTK